MMYYWRVRTRLPERFGQTCNVLARGRMNNCLVVFADGYKVVTSRNFVRKFPAPTEADDAARYYGQADAV
jgi:hypothetical protein